MSKREWDNLPGNTQFTITAMNGWTLVSNSDGTVTLKHGGGGHAATASASTSLIIEPDPGTGTGH